MIRPAFARFCWAVAALVLCSALSFGLVQRMDLPQIIGAADLIVQARVVSVESRWIEDASGKNIWTFVTLKGFSPLKGTLQAETFTLKIMGGTVGEITQEVTDTAVFAPGDEAVLFLRADPLRVVGGFQGRITIRDGNVRMSGRDIALDLPGISIKC
jgi:hypothetical protein